MALEYFDEMHNKAALGEQLGRVFAHVLCAFVAHFSSPHCHVVVGNIFSRLNCDCCSLVVGGWLVRIFIAVSFH